MSKRLISALILGVAAGTFWSLARQVQRRRRHEQRPAGKPESVQTWEGEGGALPVTGAQHGPDPAVMPVREANAADLPDAIH